MYRELGNTGKKVSVIGLGCEYLDGKPYEQVKETVDCAMENGVNILDLFMPCKEVRTNIARAIGDRREQIMIQGHFCSTNINKKYDISRDPAIAKRYFEELLNLFGYIDFGMLFFIDSDSAFRAVFETGLADYLVNLKAKGKVHHIGFSCHHPEIGMRVIETGMPDMMMFSINPAFDMLPSSEASMDYIDKNFGAEMFRGIDQSRAALYRLCEQRGVGITVMKSLGGGKLISAEHTPFAKPMTVAQCIHYALSRPAVASALVGCKTADEVRHALQYLSMSDEERDYTDILQTVRNDFRGHCVYCNHCQPCPVDIDIAAVNKYLDIALLNPDTVDPSVQSHYLTLAHKGSECLSCGSCESRCPFGVPVIENMAKAAAMFEN